MKYNDMKSSQIKNVLEKTLIGILSQIPKGMSVDAHTVISMFKNQFPDIYNGHDRKFKSKAAYHAYLSKTIKSLACDMHSNKSYSYNINGNVSPCALFDLTFVR